MLQSDSVLDMVALVLELDRLRLTLDSTHTRFARRRIQIGRWQAALSRLVRNMKSLTRKIMVRRMRLIRRFQKMAFKNAFQL